MAPKVVGTANLAVALAGDTPDFVVLCSSFTSILGGVGQIDYTAANAYLDAYAQAATRDGGPLTIAVNWATWQEVGMAFDTEVPAQWQEMKEENLRLGLRTAEGQEAFWRILANPLPQVVVSPQNLQVLLQRANAPAAPTQAEEAAAGLARGAGAMSGAGLAGGGTGGAGQAADAGAGRMGRHARPALQTASVAPRNELEAQLAEVWEQLFGIDTIGIHDNFFELGGHSLLATQILVRLQDKFGIALPVRVMFESHTIAELAGQLELMLWAAENQRRPVTTRRSGSRGGGILMVAELLTTLRAMDVQLWVEGEQFRVSTPKGALQPELRQRIKELKPGGRLDRPAPRFAGGRSDAARADPQGGPPAAAGAVVGTAAAVVFRSTDAGQLGV